MQKRAPSLINSSSTRRSRSNSAYRWLGNSAQEYGPVWRSSMPSIIYSRWSYHSKQIANHSNKKQKANQIRYQCLTSWSGQGRSLQSSKSSNNYHPGLMIILLYESIWLYHINRFSPLESATQTTPARPHLLRWHCKLSLCQEAMYLAETGRIFSRKNPARWCLTRN